uniref:Uncharacterized protein n=1 Tax=Arundo donax TaxID=35708 RepID=A0A0A9HKE4_ARUDO
MTGLHDHFFMHDFSSVWSL